MAFPWFSESLSALLNFLGEDLNGAVRRRVNLVFFAADWRLADAAADGDCGSFAGFGVNALASASGDIGDFGDSDGEPDWYIWNRDGLEGDLDRDLLICLMEGKPST